MNISEIMQEMNTTTRKLMNEHIYTMVDPESKEEIEVITSADMIEVL